MSAFRVYCINFSSGQSIQLERAKESLDRTRYLTCSSKVRFDVYLLQHGTYQKLLTSSPHGAGRKGAVLELHIALLPAERDVNKYRR